MHTNAHIFKKLGFTTAIQEYFAEHYTQIQNNLKWSQTIKTQSQNDPKITPKMH